jgi:hypothetical protein
MSDKTGVREEHEVQVRRLFETRRSSLMGKILESNWSMGILEGRLPIPKNGRAGVLKTRFPNCTTVLLLRRICSQGTYRGVRG